MFGLLRNFIHFGGYRLPLLRSRCLWTCPSSLLPSTQTWLRTQQQMEQRASLGSISWGTHLLQTRYTYYTDQVLLFFLCLFQNLEGKMWCAFAHCTAQVRWAQITHDWMERLWKTPDGGKLGFYFHNKSFFCLWLTHKHKVWRLSPLRDWTTLRCRRHGSEALAVLFHTYIEYNQNLAFLAGRMLSLACAPCPRRSWLILADSRSD